MPNYYVYSNVLPVKYPTSQKRIEVYLGQDNNSTNKTKQLYNRYPIRYRPHRHIVSDTTDLSSLVKTLDLANRIEIESSDLTIATMALPLVINGVTEINIVARRTAPSWAYSIEFFVYYNQEGYDLSNTDIELDGLLFRHVKE